MSFVALVLLAAVAQDPAPARVLGDEDVARIRELYRLTDVLGDALWPGFDAREIPIAVNCDDRQELLVGHPSPPAGFAAFGRHELGGKPVLIKDGVTRYGPRNGGWAVDLGGERTAYVGVRSEIETERYLSLLLHECFHVFQRRFHEPAEGSHGELPSDDPTYAALIGLESRVLHAALTAPDDDEVAELARMFVAVRRARREELPDEVVRAEDEAEFSEGTATYVEARMFELLAAQGGLAGAALKDDAQYRGFAGAATDRDRYLSQIRSPDGVLVSSMHLRYQIGMAECLLLDRVRPDWKRAMTDPGATQSAILDRALEPDDAERERLFAAARARFEYDRLLAAQTRLIDARLAKIRSYLEAPGRRYRIYHGDLGGRFNWKPDGPVYDVPRSIARDLGPVLVGPPGRQGRIIDPDITVWAGGIRRFEKGSLTFASKAVPIIFRPDYLEWIDQDPAPDESDLTVEAERTDRGVHHGVRIVTDGFELTVDRARITRAKRLVEIHPLSR